MSKMGEIMNRLTRTGLPVFIFIIMCFLSACQKNPEKNVVVSKNDGTFDIYATAPTQEESSQYAVSTQSIERDFMSTDGSVQFSMSLDIENLNEYVPVIEVTPHYLTSDDVQRVANVLFEGADFKEAQILSSPSYGKEDIRQKIARWAPFANNDALEVLFGSIPNGTSELVQEFINNYTSMYETASEGSYNVPCQWEFRKSSYYSFPKEIADKRDTAAENDVISVELQYGDVYYKIDANRRDQNDFQQNTISVYLYEGIGPDLIDERIFRAQLCRTDKPSAVQINAASEIAQMMLTKMELGDWVVDQQYVETTYYGNIAEYIIHVTATPAFKGMSVVRQPQLSNLRNADEYSSTYYLTDAHFQFSANGELVSFQLYSPVDIVETANENVATLSLQEQIDYGRQFLVLSDRGTYGLTPDIIESYEETFGEEVICKIDICDYDYALTRIKIPDVDENYYYIPGLTLYGTIDYCGKDTGTVYGASGETFGSSRMKTLVSINAINGSIIESSSR